MFDFFKRRKPEPAAPAAEDVPEPTGAPTAEPDAPAPAVDHAPAPTPLQPTPPAMPVAAPAAVPAAEVASVAGDDTAVEPQKRSWTDRLRAGLGKSRERLTSALTGVFRSRTLDDDTLEELETALLMADVGVAATLHLLEDLRTRFRAAGGAEEPKALLKAAIVDLIGPLEKPLVITSARPFVIMIAGVNGAGKTTSIGKLARYFQDQGLTVLLAAGDTFRAAAREQLVIWGERNNVPVIAQAGGDPAAVMFDAIAAAKGRGIDVVLADTAGRLPTQLHLMEEIRKVRRVIAKADPTAPHETLLVLDANTGQNAVAQVKAFDEALGLTGLVLTKLDGSAKGGTVCAIAKERPIPLRFVGVGEGIEDLRPFVASDFVDALLG